MSTLSKLARKYLVNTKLSELNINKICPLQILSAPVPKDGRVNSTMSHIPLSWRMTRGHSENAWFV